MNRLPSCPASFKKWWNEHYQSLRRLLEVFLAFGCGVLNIVSFGSPYWLDLSDKGHIGLWQNCTQMKCQLLQHPSPTVIGVRVLLSIALISGLCGWAVGMVALVLHRSRYLFPVALAFSIQAFMLFLGELVYVGEIHSVKGAKEGWSYSIGWVGFFTVLTSALYYLLVGLYRLRHPLKDNTFTQQIYAPLNQWDDMSTSGSDTDDDQL